MMLICCRPLGQARCGPVMQSKLLISLLGVCFLELARGFGSVSSRCVDLAGHPHGFSMCDRGPTTRQGATKRPGTLDTIQRGTKTIRRGLKTLHRQLQTIDAPVFRKAHHMITPLTHLLTLARKETADSMSALSTDKTAAASSASADLKVLFDYLDEDDSGDISVHELAQLAALLGEKWKAEYIQSLMDTIDTDGNGTIDFEEFEAWHNKDWSSPEHVLNVDQKERLDTYAQLLNLRFAKDASIEFKPKADGQLQVPGFYLLQDYQRLVLGGGLQGAVEEVGLTPLQVEGVIPKALKGAYFVTGPGILKQEGKNVHPFDGHGLVRRFDVDGSQALSPLLLPTHANPLGLSPHPLLVPMHA